MGRPKGYEREQVLQRAMELFSRKGFEGAHLNELVEVTGLNRFSLYKEFGGKNGLFHEALNTYFDWLAGIAAVLFREPKGLQNIQDYLDKLVETRFKYGCFLVNTLTEHDVLDNESNKAARGFLRKAEQALADNLHAAQDKGELSKTHDPATLARFITLFDIGLVTYDVIQPKSNEKIAVRSILNDLLK